MSHFVHGYSCSKCLEPQIDESEMDDFGNQICENINERWPNYESNLDLVIPALLDPRFKEFSFMQGVPKKAEC